MSANYDAELSQLTAEILREAVQVFDPSDPGQLLTNPVLAAWSTNMFGGLAPTASFMAVTKIKRSTMKMACGTITKSGAAG